MFGDDPLFDLGSTLILRTGDNYETLAQMRRDLADFLVRVPEVTDVQDILEERLRGPVGRVLTYRCFTDAFTATS